MSYDKGVWYKVHVCMHPLLIFKSIHFSECQFHIKYNIKVPQNTCLLSVWEMSPFKIVLQKIS